jgi:predicted dehydrogenase
MGQAVRVGIAGAGFIGAVHARSARLAGAHLAGVASATPESAERAAARLGIERAYASSEELVRSDDIDVVHICTPNHLHGPLAEAALAAGKHVVCEKPLALDAAEASALLAAADAAGKVAAVPFVYRFYPTIREARERVRTGATGPLYLLHGSYLQDWLLRPDDDNWRVEPDLGGASRAFADIGSHWCDLVEFVSGHRIARLSARLTTAIPERVRHEARKAFSTGDDGGDGDGEVRRVSTEDAAVVQFETDRGAFGTVVVSQISAGRKNRLWLEIDGAQEALAFDQEVPETLWVGRRDRTTILRRDPEQLSAAAARLSTLPPGHPEGYAQCFDRFVEDVYATIAEGRAPDGLPTFADGLRAVTITEAVLTSAREERWVDVPLPTSAEATP